MGVFKEFDKRRMKVGILFAFPLLSLNSNYYFRAENTIQKP
jgi:hypothetical protein